MGNINWSIGLRPTKLADLFMLYIVQPKDIIALQ